MPSSHWSKIPPEIACEIIGHNANDVPCLRAMSLVSTTMHSLAIEHLFSVIHFACAEDFPWWLDMVRATPVLANSVKRVKFSQPDKSWLESHRRLHDVSKNQPPTHTKLALATIPPVIPSLPNVSDVEWEYIFDLRDLKMVVAYMALLPNVQKLSLKTMSFNGLLPFINFIVACGNLKALSFVETAVDEEYIEPDYESDESSNSESDSDGSIASGGDETSNFEPDSDGNIASGLRGDWLQLGPIILTGLEELAVSKCAPTHWGGREEYLIHLVEHCSPGLKSLTFASLGNEEPETFGDPCSILAMEKLLRFGAPTITNLVIEPTLSDDVRITEMMRRLPPFPALEVLTIWLRANDHATQMLHAFAPAPNLTKLVFRIIFCHEYIGENHEEFDDILLTLFPRSGSKLMKTVLAQKFPLIQKVGFHFCVPHDSDIHFRRSFRWSRVEQLKWRMKKTGADLEEYLEVQWLDMDNDCRPVVYNKTNGKPPWTVSRKSWEEDPPTEDSDWEADRSDPGWDSDSLYPPRAWTDADERAYRAEMLAECESYDYY
ncbi:hypothetical protein DFH06DRAFT_1468998 [Mycena polygramma]|nr:hypothetical protein DFH06DRAFT_1468998 [Mycena polygramma]